MTSIAKFKIHLLILFFCIFSSCNMSFTSKERINLDIFNCNITKSYDIVDEIKEEIYVVGHAYGKPGEGDFFPQNLINYFANVENLDQSHLALTGDFVRINSIENFQKVKKYIDQNFKNYFISIGNHEIENSKKNFDFVFENDFYTYEFNNFLLIAANFSNSNWLPSPTDIETINNLVASSNKNNVIILSHQIFWLEEIQNSIKPNSDALLKEDLKSDSLSWIKHLEDKNIIVISGDYGAWGDKTFCFQDKNKLFIANGIGNHPNDTILKITDYGNSFEIKEVSINN